MTIFDPVLRDGIKSRYEPNEAALVLAHAILFSDKGTDKPDEAIRSYLETLDGQIARQASKWLETGKFIIST